MRLKRDSKGRFLPRTRGKNNPRTRGEIIWDGEDPYMRRSAVVEKAADGRYVLKTSSPTGVRREPFRTENAAINAGLTFLTQGFLSGKEPKARPRRRYRKSNPGGFLGLPLWAWLVGGAAAFYFLVVRKSAANGPNLAVMPGGATAQQALQQATDRPVDGYGLYRGY